jgi:uncharacterized protein (TIGR03084 family)
MPTAPGNSGTPGTMPMDEIVAALVEQQEELESLLATLDEDGWARPTRCEGWDVADVVLHVAQTDELALGSAQGRFAEAIDALTRDVGPAMDVDEGAALMVERQRGMAPSVLHKRWEDGAATLADALRHTDPSERVVWVAGELSARTLATTRLAETWIHTGDVADALGRVLPPSDRLQPVARLAWRTLPYAFGKARRVMSGPVAFELTGPDGDPWSFVPDGAPAVTVVRGDAVELCLVAARRAEPADTGLTGEGPDAEAVLELVRTYA